MTEPETPRPLDSAELFRLHARFVARFLYRLGVPANMIDDVVQEVFIVVHQRGGYVPGPAKPTSYLAVIATNAASKLRRSERVRQGRASERAPDELVSGLASPERALDDRDCLSRVRAALDRMDPTLGTTLLLADGEEESCASIAAAMSVPIGTVYWRLHRARSKFESALKVVDAELARAPGAELRKARASAREAESVPPVVLRRRVSMAMLFGWPTSKFSETEAYALLRQSSQPESVPLDVPRILARHLEDIARGAPAPQWATAASAGHVVTLLKLGTWISGASLTMGALYMAALSSVGSPPADAPAPFVRGAIARAPAHTPAVPQAEPAAPQERAPQVATAPASDGQGVKSVRPAARGVGRRISGNTTVNAAVRSLAPRVPGAPAAEAQGASLKSADALPAAASQSSAPEHVAGPAPSLSAADELRLLAEAAALAERKPREALMMLERLQRGGASAYLDEEQQYIAIVAKRAAGRATEARADAEAFFRKYPRSGFAPRVRALLGELVRE
jgi:RNA polymerase sigma-70 factor (ECF subfamily)